MSLDARVLSRVALGRPAIALTLLLGWLWILVNPVAWGSYVASLVALAACVGLEAVRLRRWSESSLPRLVVAAIFFVAVGLLRQAGGGWKAGVGGGGRGAGEAAAPDGRGRPGRRDGRRASGDPGHGQAGQHGDGA